VDFTVAGLQILRNNNLIHRDLKPQVWLILFYLTSISYLYMAMYIDHFFKGGSKPMAKFVFYIFHGT
jgi:hypothetical protein